MGEEGVTVTLVFALMGAEPLSAELLQAIDNGGAKEFNHLGEMVDHRVIFASEIHAKVRDDIAVKPLDLQASLNPPWFSLSDPPYESYEGVVAAEEVAEWAGGGQLPLRPQHPQPARTDLDQ